MSDRKQRNPWRARYKPGPKPGTVSEGTLKPQDVLRAIVEMLSEVEGDLPKLPVSDGDTWWDSEDCAETWEELFGLADVHAPKGYYFGSHPGDGALFGYWAEEEL
jgi:hypothetical protein